MSRNVCVMLYDSIRKYPVMKEFTQYTHLDL